MKLTVKQYHYFGKDPGFKGSLINKDSWDALRLSDGRQNRAFIIPADRVSWQEKCDKSDMLRQRAKDISAVLSSGFRSLDSCGVGSACLEYLIKKENPGIFLRCSDFAPRTVERLKGLFGEADEIAEFDMLGGAWKNHGPDSLCLLQRIDTEFDDAQLYKVFKDMHGCGVENVLFLPAELLTIPKALYHRAKYFLFRLFKKELTFAGYLRTGESFRSLFSRFYDIKSTGTFGGLTGYLLIKKGLKLK